MTSRSACNGSRFPHYRNRQVGEGVIRRKTVNGHRVPGPDLVCRWCGGVIQSKSTEQVYCDRECWSADLQNRASKARLAYELRQKGYSWARIGAELLQNPRSAHTSARRWARLRGLEWPVRDRTGRTYWNGKSS